MNKFIENNKKIIILIVLIIIGFFSAYLKKDIVLIGNKEEILVFTETYKEQGIKECYTILGFNFNCKKIDINNINIENNIEKNKLGDYTVNYIINKKIITRKIKVIDNEPPTIELVDDNLSCPNKPYEEKGYKAYDNYDNDITDKVKITKEENKIKYSVLDSSNNKTEVIRDVEYKDIELPNITLYGNEIMYVLKGNNYIEPGYKAEDNCEGDITNKVKTTSNLNTNIVGTYNIDYEVADSSNNISKKTRTIKVINKQETINPGNKIVYLTFDDGPSVYTSNLLDILKIYNIKVTFFVINKGNTHLIKRAYNEGHSIGIHSYTHNYGLIYQSVYNYFDDLNKMNEIIKNNTGKYSSIIRFPGGSSNTVSNFNPGIMTILTKEVEYRGYKYFDWNVGSSDTVLNDKTVIANNIISGIQRNNVSIVLQHDTNYASIEATKDVIEWGLANGYTFLPLDVTSPSIHHGVKN